MASAITSTNQEATFGRLLIYKSRLPRLTHPKKAGKLRDDKIRVAALLPGVWMKKNLRTCCLTFTAVLLLTACGSGRLPEKATGQPALTETAVYMTVEAMTTQIVQTDQAGQTLSAPPPTPTPTLSPSPQPSPTAVILQLLTPTARPTGTTQTPSGPCNLAEFISETIPDGSQFFPGSLFTKTWLLRNIGSCAWTAGYLLEYVSGNVSTIKTTQPFTTVNILPGQTVQISAEITAPETPGSYRADFKLRDASGETFSFRNPANTFWVDFDVVSSTYNLADNYCAAQWTSGAGPLPCPGNAGDSRGFVFSDPAPKLENGYIDDETALWMGEQSIDNGYIKGTYPGLKLPDGARFEVTIGCAVEKKACDAIIALNYQEGTLPMQTLAYWREVQDGTFHQVSWDLSSLSGKNVQIILIVDANGSYTDDMIHLLQPRIVR